MGEKRHVIEVSHVNKNFRDNKVLMRTLHASSTKTTTKRRYLQKSPKLCAFWS